MFSGEGEYEWPGGSSVSRFFFPGVVCGIRWLGWLEGLSWKKLLRRLFLSWTWACAATPPKPCLKTTLLDTPLGIRSCTYYESTWLLMKRSSCTSHCSPGPHACRRLFLADFGGGVYFHGVSRGCGFRHTDRHSFGDVACWLAHCIYCIQFPWGNNFVTVFISWLLCWKQKTLRSVDGQRPWIENPMKKFSYHPVRTAVCFSLWGGTLMSMRVV